MVYSMALSTDLLSISVAAARVNTIEYLHCSVAIYLLLHADICTAYCDYFYL